jgi:hypothetical protein
VHKIRHTTPRWQIILRDVSQYAVGAFILLFQTVTGHYNQTLAAVGGALLGGPAVIAGINLFRGSVQEEQEDTTGPPSSDQESPLSVR